MKKNSFTSLAKYALALLIGTTAFSCSEDVALDSIATLDDSRVPITFSASFDTTTRGSIIGSDEFDSFTVYAYYQDGEPFMEGVEFKLEGGVWASTDSFYWPTSSTELTFYAYTPADDSTVSNGISFKEGVITYNMSGVENANLPDITTAYTVQESGSVALSFSRNVAILQFNVATTDAAAAVTSVEVSGIDDSGELTIGTETAWSSLASSGASYGAGISSVTPSTTAQSITADNGYIMVIPQTVSELSIVAKNESASKEYNLEDVEWEANKIYTYQISADGIVAVVDDANDDDNVTVAADDADLTDEESANCYILNPSSSAALVYYIPVEERINTFWGNNGYENVSANCIGDDTIWTAEILWGDVAALGDLTVERVTSTEFDDAVNANSALKVTLPKNYNHGNVVVAVKNEAGTILWSWHLWITDYDPYQTPSKINNYAYSVGNGYLNRLVDGTASFYYIAYNGTAWSAAYSSSYMMDRNIGALSNTSDGYSEGITTASNVNGRGALYYQFGRKDPFPAAAPIVGDTQPSKKSTTYTMEEVINNPTVFAYGSGYKWLDDSSAKYADENNFWNDPETNTGKTATIYGQQYDYTYPIESTTSKSIFDPSPRGYKIPGWLTWTSIEAYSMTTYTNGVRFYSGTSYYPSYFCNGYLNGVNSNGCTNYGNYGYAVCWSNVQFEINGTYSGLGLAYKYGANSTSVKESSMELNRRHGVPVRPVSYTE